MCFQQQVTPPDIDDHGRAFENLFQFIVWVFPYRTKRTLQKRHFGEGFSPSPDAFYSPSSPSSWASLSPLAPPSAFIASSLIYFLLPPPPPLSTASILIIHHAVASRSSTLAVFLFWMFEGSSSSMQDHFLSRVPSIMAGSKLQKRRKGEPKARLSNLLSPSLKCLPADSKQTFESSAHGRIAHIFRRDKLASSTTVSPDLFRHWSNLLTSLDISRSQPRETLHLGKSRATRYYHS